MSIIAREVEFARGEPPQTYHAVEQADYIAIVALTRGGKIAIVRQYRPALEAFAWELPAGLVDPGEAPAECCRRELIEETGLTARAIHALGREVPLHGPPQQPRPHVLRRSRRAYRRLRAGAGHRRKAGIADGDRSPDQGWRVRLPAPHRRVAARGAARISHLAQDPCEKGSCEKGPCEKDTGETTTAAEAVRPMTAYPSFATCGRARARAPSARDAWRRTPRISETAAAPGRFPRRGSKPSPPAASAATSDSSSARQSRRRALRIAAPALPRPSAAATGRPLPEPRPAPAPRSPRHAAAP